VTLTDHVFRWSHSGKLFLNGPDRKAAGAVFQRADGWRWVGYPGGATIPCGKTYATHEEAADGLMTYLEAID